MTNKLATTCLAVFVVVCSIGHEGRAVEKTDAPDQTAIARASQDLDGDGVPDVADHCAATRRCEYGVIGPDGCPIAFNLDLKGAIFGKNSAALSPASSRHLEEAVESMMCWTLVKIEIAGRAESCEDHPDAISLQRALAVKHYLVSAGLPASRILSVEGYGIDRPLVAGACGRELNRSAELIQIR